MVEVIDETRRYPSPEALARAAGALLARLGLEEREFTLVLVGDDAIIARNFSDRGIDAPTDVLSYPTHEPGDVGMPRLSFLGDIFISLDTAARQAAARGHDLETEVKVLTAHGLMHLLGYDHETEEAWRDFKNAQRLILEPTTF